MGTIIKDRLRDWGDSAVGKMLAVYVQRPEFNTNMHIKSHMCWLTCLILALRKWRQNGPWDSLPSQ